MKKHLSRSLFFCVSLLLISGIGISGFADPATTETTGTETSCGACCGAEKPAAALASWNDSAAKKAVIDFVAKVTDTASPDYLPPGDRVAVFDNDGTLWTEQPLYFQIFFALERVKTLAAGHPEWKTEEPFAALLKGDTKSAIGSMESLMKIVYATQTNISSEEFRTISAEWVTGAKHPKLKRTFAECVYQPMLEMLIYLRSYGFKTYIVTGGDTEFVRSFAEKVYGIPPEQVIGSRMKSAYKIADEKPVVMREPAFSFNNDGPGKPVGIVEQIGRRPVIAFGNSDGDYEMLEYTTRGAKGPSLGIFIHHTDADREYAYDRKSLVGKLDRGLTDAAKQGWLVVDMKNDWKTIYPPENTAASAPVKQQDAANNAAGSAASEGMALIPAGSFIMGTDDPNSFANERPAHTVTLKTYYIDINDVTNAEFAKFVAATGYVTTAEQPVDWEKMKKEVPPGTPRPRDSVLAPGSLVFVATKGPVDLHNMRNWWHWTNGANWHQPEGPGSTIEGRENHPVVQVSWEDAAAYAKWAGKRLPTEAEWEYAARGGLVRARYVWGDDPKPGGKYMANTWTGEFPYKNDSADGFAGTSPVASYPKNGYGLYDMAGNVWNWCSDVYRGDTFAVRANNPELCGNPHGPSLTDPETKLAGDPSPPSVPGAERRVIKGGSFLCNPVYCESYRPSARRGTPPDTGSSHVGFRCARDAE